MLPDILEEQPSGARRHDGSQGGGKVSSFGDRVHYHHHRIVAGQLWQFDYEVYANGVPWSLGNRKGVKFSDWVMFMSLNPKAEVTSRHISSDVPGHLRPPVVPGY